MSLISATLGDSGDTGAFMLDGIWNCLLCAPSACAFGVSAQSTNFFAASMCLPAEGMYWPPGIQIVPQLFALRDHLGVCLDLCHAAVEFEDAADCLRQLDRAGIRIHKMQISAGLRLPRTPAGSRSG